MTGGVPMSGVMEAADEVGSMLRDAAAGFLSARHSTTHLKSSIDVPRRVNRAHWREMGELGWLGLGLTEEAGGSGLGLGAATILTALFGRALFPEPFIAAAIMPSVLLNACGSLPAARELAAGLASGEKLLTLAWQDRLGQIEPEVSRLQLVNGSLSGVKHFVSAVEDVVLVSAAHEGKPVIVAVSADAAGVAVARQATGHSSIADLRFEHAPILFGAPLLTGAAAEGALRQAIDAGRIAASAQLAGIAAGCLQQTIEYVRTRVQFGRPIGSFQTIQHRCVDLHIEVQLAEASCKHALSLHESGPGDPPNGFAISASKARSGDAAMRVGKAAVQMHGAMGYTEEAGIGLCVRAAMFFASWLGSSRAHRRQFFKSRPATEATELAHG